MILISQSLHRDVRYMVKILILNAGVSNKGTYALIRTIAENLKQYIPNAEFTFMGIELNRNELPIKKQLAINASKNIAPWLYLAECLLIRICRIINVKLKISDRDGINIYIDNDLIINSGGDHLSGEFNKFGLSTFMNVLYAIILKKPVVLYGESLGYYKNPVFTYIANYIFEKVDLILVREKISKKYLEGHVANPNIYLTADPAFNLRSVNSLQVEEIFKGENVNIARPLIGINPSGLISKISKRDNDEIASIFAKLADDLIYNLDATVLLVPHVYTQNVDDRRSINLIYEKVINKRRVNLIKNEYSPEELKGLIGSCDLFIGARMHATIASTSMMVPTVGIAYSHKMHGIIGEMVGLNEYIIDINELNYDNLNQKVFDAWENRDLIHKILEKNIPLIKHESELNGRYVSDLLSTLNSNGRL